MNTMNTKKQFNKIMKRIQDMQMECNEELDYLKKSQTKTKFEVKNPGKKLKNLINRLNKVKREYQVLKIR